MVGAGASALADDALKAILSKKMLPDNAGITSYTTVFNEIEAADAAADAPAHVRVPAPAEDVRDVAKRTQQPCV
jgi:hypothetical protein